METNICWDCGCEFDVDESNSTVLCNSCWIIAVDGHSERGDEELFED